jgi:hydroxymethylpyrimidine pyrophosphatase-like HAD family hydrolase
MTSRVIALDLDGTLLTPKKPAPLFSRSAKRAKEAGYQSLSSPGRHHVAIHPFIRHWR